MTLAPIDVWGAAVGRTRWDLETQVQKLLAFVDEHGDAEEFEVFLQDEADADEDDDEGEGDEGPTCAYCGAEEEENSAPIERCEADPKPHCLSCHVARNLADDGSATAEAEAERILRATDPENQEGA